MTDSAPLQPLPDDNSAFTPVGDADLTADPETGRGPGGIPLGDGTGGEAADAQADAGGGDAGGARPGGATPGGRPGDPS